MFSPNPRVQSAYSRTDSAKPSDRETGGAGPTSDPSGDLICYKTAERYLLLLLQMYLINNLSENSSYL